MATPAYPSPGPRVVTLPFGAVGQTARVTDLQGREGGVSVSLPTSPVRRQVVSLPQGQWTRAATAAPMRPKLFVPDSASGSPTATAPALSGTWSVSVSGSSSTAAPGGPSYGSSITMPVVQGLQGVSTAPTPAPAAMMGMGMQAQSLKGSVCSTRMGSPNHSDAHELRPMVETTRTSLGSSHSTASTTVFNPTASAINLTSSNGSGGLGSQSEHSDPEKQCTGSMSIARHMQPPPTTATAVVQRAGSTGMFARAVSSVLSTSPRASSGNGARSPSNSGSPTPSRGQGPTRIQVVPVSSRSVSPGSAVATAPATNTNTMTTTTTTTSMSPSMSSISGSCPSSMAQLPTMPAAASLSMVRRLIAAPAPASPPVAGDMEFRQTSTASSFAFSLRATSVATTAGTPQASAVIAAENLPNYQAASTRPEGPEVPPKPLFSPAPSYSPATSQRSIRGGSEGRDQPMATPRVSSKQPADQERPSSEDPSDPMKTIPIGVAEDGKDPVKPLVLPISSAASAVASVVRNPSKTSSERSWQASLPGASAAAAGAEDSSSKGQGLLFSCSSSILKNSQSNSNCNHNSSSAAASSSPSRSWSPGENLGEHLQSQRRQSTPNTSGEGEVEMEMDMEKEESSIDAQLLDSSNNNNRGASCDANESGDAGCPQPKDGEDDYDDEDEAALGGSPLPLRSSLSCISLEHQQFLRAADRERRWLRRALSMEVKSARELARREEYFAKQEEDQKQREEQKRERVRSQSARRHVQFTESLAQTELKRKAHVMAQDTRLHELEVAERAREEVLEHSRQAWQKAYDEAREARSQRAGRAQKASEEKERERQARLEERLERERQREQRLLEHRSQCKSQSLSLSSSRASRQAQKLADIEQKQGARRNSLSGQVAEKSSRAEEIKLERGRLAAYRRSAQEEARRALETVKKEMQRQTVSHRYDPERLQEQVDRLLEQSVLPPPMQRSIVCGKAPHPSPETSISNNNSSSNSNSKSSGGGNNNNNNHINNNNTNNNNNNNNNSCNSSSSRKPHSSPSSSRPPSRPPGASVPGA